jgi:hypothetical protein
VGLPSEQVAEELERGELHQGLWMIALTEADGDVRAAQPMYVRMRIATLKEESEQQKRQEEQQQVALKARYSSWPLIRSGRVLSLRDRLLSGRGARREAGSPGL